MPILRRRKQDRGVRYQRHGDQAVTYPIPAAALKESVAFIGRTGSGKSYAAKGAVEQLLRDGARVCIVDPTGVWFGLRSSADGHAAGFPVVVFGGAHADQAIGEASGGPLATITRPRCATG